MLLFISLLFVSAIRGQTIISRDPEIGRMINEISRGRIEQYIRKLAGFHTRLNLSSKNDPEKGIGAAWNWIKSEMEKNIPVSGEENIRNGYRSYTSVFKR